MVLCASILLTACVNPRLAEMNRQSQQKDDAITEYATVKRPLAAAGTLKWSDYWAGLYATLQTNPVRPDDMIMARGASDMIDASTKFESGQISKTEYDKVTREVQLQVQQQLANAQQQMEAAAAQQAQANRAMYLQYYLHTRPVTTTCYGNSCTTQ